jgi:hypothetical protein
MIFLSFSIEMLWYLVPIAFFGGLTAARDATSSKVGISPVSSFNPIRLRG